MSIYLRNFFRLLILVFIQTMILYKIPLRWWANPGIPSYTPFIYMLFIVLLPISTKKSYVLLISFFTGIVMDAFSDTGGIHAVACLLMGMSRTTLLEFILPKPLEEYKNAAPTIDEMQIKPFLVYVGSMFFIHLTTYYFIEIWSFKAILYVLFKIILSLITSMIFSIIYALLFSRSINVKYYD